MYHVMSAEQESKQAMNRPMPVPGKPERSEGSRRRSSMAVATKVVGAIRHRPAATQDPRLLRPEQAAAR